MSVDAHNHVDLAAAALGEPAEGLIAEATAAGVRGMIIAGISPEGAAAQRALCAGAPSRGWTLGLHPEQVAAWVSAGEEDRIDAAIDALPGALLGAVGLGELGLDLRFPLALGAQRRAFDAGLRLAEDSGLPLVLHVVGAHEEVIARLRGRPRRGMVHAFSGSAEQARRYLALGLHLSFGGAITLGPSSKRSAALRATPPERLLIETDAPDQAPRLAEGGPRAQHGRPAMLGAIARAAAALRAEPAQAVWAQAGENARRLFALEDGAAPPWGG